MNKEIKIEHSYNKSVVTGYGENQGFPQEVSFVIENEGDGEFSIKMEADDYYSSAYTVSGDFLRQVKMVIETMVGNK